MRHEAVQAGAVATGEPGRLRLATFVAFALDQLPAAPARVLEVGCGGGEVALALARAAYDVTAIDPRAPEGAFSAGSGSRSSRTRAASTPSWPACRCTTCTTSVRRSTASPGR